MNHLKLRILFCFLFTVIFKHFIFLNKYAETLFKKDWNTLIYGTIRKKQNPFFYRTPPSKFLVYSGTLSFLLFSSRKRTL